MLTSPTCHTITITFLVVITSKIYSLSNFQVTILLLSQLAVSNSLQPHGLQHTRILCPSPSPGACLILYPVSQCCHPTISSSVISFSSCLQSFPVSGSFLMSQLFASGGQSIGVSASVLPINIQHWFPLGLTGLISLQSMGLSRVFSNTTVQKHQSLGTQPSLWSNSHMPFSISSVQFSRSVVSDSLWPHELQR